MKRKKKLRRAKRNAFLTKHESSDETAKRIEWVSLVVDVAIMSVAISRTSSLRMLVFQKARSLRSLTLWVVVAGTICCCCCCCCCNCCCWWWRWWYCCCYCCCCFPAPAQHSSRPRPCRTFRKHAPPFSPPPPLLKSPPPPTTLPSPHLTHTNWVLLLIFSISICLVMSFESRKPLMHSSSIRRSCGNPTLKDEFILGTMGVIIGIIWHRSRGLFKFQQRGEEDSALPLSLLSLLFVGGDRKIGFGHCQIVIILKNPLKSLSASKSVLSLAAC